MQNADLKNVHHLYHVKDFEGAREILLNLQNRFPEFELYTAKLEECDRLIAAKQKSEPSALDADKNDDIEPTLRNPAYATGSLSAEDARAGGKKQLSEGHLESARAYFIRAHERDRTDLESLVTAAQIDLTLGNYESALDRAQFSIGANPDLRKAYQIAEQACIEMQRYDEANRFFLSQPQVKYPEKPHVRGHNPTLPKSLTMPTIAGSGNDYTYIMERASIFAAEQRPYTKTVSIVMPVYNRAKILANTLAALTHQTYPQTLTQVIVVDDGSSDDVHRVIRKYDDKLNLLYARQADSGYRLAAARNLGIRLATGEAVIFMDADILPCPTDVENYMRVMHVSERAVLIGHRRYVDVTNLSDDKILSNISEALDLPSINPDNDVADHRDDEGDSIDWRLPTYKNNRELRDDLWAFTKGAGGNLAVPMALIEKAGLVDEDFAAWGCEDMEFNFRLQNAGGYFIPLLNVMSLHQEPLGDQDSEDDKTEEALEESFRAKGHKITRELLMTKCSAPTVRRYTRGLKIEVPKVSIYIPVYNAEQFIKQAVDSCLAQDFDDLEICICNDGSTDRTLEVLETNYADNPRVRWITQDNAGIGAATNAAIRMCRGMYIGQLDADDLLKPDAVRSCIVVLDNKPVDAVYADCDYINSDGKIIRNGWCGGEYERDWMATAMIATHFRMFRRRVWSRIEPCNEQIENAVDFDLWLKISERCNIQHIHKKLYSYRWHGKNTSIKDRKRQENNHFKVVETGLARTGLAEFWTAQPMGNRLNPREFKVIPRPDLPAVLPSDVILMIPTCEKYLPKKLAVRRTWAKRLKQFGFRYYFLQGNEKSTHAYMEGDTIYVPCADNYESLLLKLVLGYAFAERNLKFSYLYKIDDDCFPNLGRLAEKIVPQLKGNQYVGGATHAKGTPINNEWHFGKCSQSKFDIPYKHSVAPVSYAKGGYGYFLRRDVLPFLIREIPTLTQELVDGVYSYEDVRIGELLAESEIRVHRLKGYEVSKDDQLDDYTVIFDIGAPSTFDHIERALSNRKL